MRRFVFVILTLLLSVQPAFAATPNDPLFSKQWFWSKIGAPFAWDQTVGSKEVIVAVLDTGIDIDHEDLKANIFTNAKEVARNGIDDDRNGYVDDVNGYDMLDRDADPRPETNTSVFGVNHGTVVAGMIGAVGDNRKGITGLNWQVKILPVRVLDANGNGAFAGVVEGLRYATMMGADVVNLSFVGDDTSPDLQRAVTEAIRGGTVIVAALGNAAGGRDVDVDPVYPVCLPGVIGVVASDTNDARADFSNYGKNCADLAAPGVDMFGTQVTGGVQAYAGGWKGTSLAAPLVSGTVALLRAVYPQATPEELEIVLKVAVDPLKRTEEKVSLGALGTGRLSVDKALRAAGSIVKDKQGSVVSMASVASVLSGSISVLRLSTSQGMLVHQVSLPAAMNGKTVFVRPAGPLQAPLGIAWLVYAADGAQDSGAVLGYTADGVLAWESNVLPANSGQQSAAAALWHGVPVLWRVRLGTNTALATDRRGVLRGVVDFGGPVSEFTVVDVNKDGILDLQARTPSGLQTYSTDGDRM